MASDIQGEDKSGFLTSLKEYQRRPGAADQKGTNFEIRMSALIYLRALRTSKHFRLAVNDAAAGDFDDIVFSTMVENNEKRLFIQLKHRTGVISKNLLSSATGKLSLNKYFRSVQADILSGNFRNVLFVLYTNAAVNACTSVTPGLIDTDTIDLISTGGNFGNVLKVDIEDDPCAAFREEPGASEFIKRFFIFCNQASVDFLDELIRQEFFRFANGSISNYKTLHSAFLNKIEIWWAKSGSTPYLCENWKEWEEIKMNIKEEMLLFSEMKFRDDVLLKFVKEVIDSKSRLVHVIYSNSDASFRCVKTLQAFSYLGGSPFVFMNAIEPKGSHELWISGWADYLVIDLPDNACISVVTEALRNSAAKKIIVVTDSANISSLDNEVPERYYEMRDSISFLQLDHISQTTLLQRKVHFQGTSVKIHDLGAKNLHDENWLASLISCKEISSPPTSGNDFYIPRRMSRNILIKEEVLSDEKMNGVFYVADVTVNQLNNLVNSSQSNSNTGNSNNKKKFMAISHSEVPSIVTNLESQERSKSDPPVHILQMKDDSLYWLWSLGDCEQLSKYIEAETRDISDVTKLIIKCKTCTPGEEELIDAELKTVVVTGEPGIGKSGLLSQVAIRLKKLYPTFWVIVVKLSEFSSYLHETTSLGKVKSSDLFNILFKAARVEGSVLGEGLLKNAVEITGRAFILCDAFDEISPWYTETVISILQLIQQSKVCTLFVTSRRIIEEKLETALQTRVFVLQPLTEFEVTKFFDKFWGEARALKVLRAFNSTLNFDNGLPVSSYPLHMKMILETYNEVVLSNKFSELPKVLNINYLLERFIENKLKIFYGEKSKIEGVGSDILMETHRKAFMELHMYCSLRVLNICEELPSEMKREVTRKIEDYLKFIENGKEKTGIIDGIAFGNPLFIHQIFAEFFAGLWLAEHRHEAQTFIQKTYFTSWYKTVYDVFNRILAKECPTHLAVLNKDVMELGNTVNMLSRDAAGRTPLHLGVQGNGARDLQIVKLLLDRAADVECCDSLLEMSPLYYAVKVESWDVVILLLQRGAQVKENILKMKSVKSFISKLSNKRLSFRGYISSGFEVNWPVFEGHETILHVAARYGNEKCVKILKKYGADINVKNLKGSTPLHGAVDGENAAIVLYLLKCGANPSASDSNGITPLHKAVKNRSLKVLKLLLKYGALTTAIDNLGDTPLHKVAILGNPDAVKPLICYGSPISALNKDGNTALHEAVLSGRTETVKMFLKNRIPVDILGSREHTPLHKAASYGTPEISKVLLDHGASVMCRNVYKNTPLYLAVKWYQRRIVIMLLDKGADIDTVNEHGNTALHKTVRQQNVSLMKLLLDRGASVNVRNDFGNSPLHIAVFWKNIAAVKLLLPARAEVNSVNGDGDTPLHLAVRWQRTMFQDSILGTWYRDESRYRHGPDPDVWRQSLLLHDLLSYGASTSSKNKSGNTPLHEAAKWQHEDTVATLLRIGASVNDKNNCGSTPLHVAAGCNNFKVAQLLIEARADINAVNLEGDTALDIADRWDRTAVQKLLLEHGADTSRTNFRSPLTFEENLQTVKL
ncbi:uncharacterized protein [Anabrus simplex]|uniref:uncharacterized protein n=1 Tax=Anabrus simplex TaxID=316456 RepID=UPI0035A27264